MLPALPFMATPDSCRVFINTSRTGLLNYPRPRVPLPIEQLFQCLPILIGEWLPWGSEKPRMYCLFIADRMYRTFGKVLDHIHSDVAIVFSWPKPDDNLLDSFVYVLHSPNLQALFGDVVLVDTQRVNPEVAQNISFRSCVSPPLFEHSKTCKCQYL